MALKSGPDAFLYVGGYNITGDLTEFKDHLEAKTEEVTVLNSSYQLNAPVGTKMAKLELAGFYNDAALAGVAALANTQVGTVRVAVYGVEGTATGKRFVGWSGALTAHFERIVARDAISKITARFENNGIVEPGVVLRPLAAATATGFGVGNAASASGPAIDFGTSNVSGAAAYLMMTHSSGATSSGVSVEIMHSVDHETWASYGGFSNVTATGPNSSWAQRINSTAPIQRYVTERHRDAAGSSFSSAVFFVGLAPH